MTTSDHLPPEAVLLDLAVRTKTEVLKALAARAAALSGREAAAILRALGDREKLGSTGVGSGVALPHAGLAGLAVPVVLFVRLARPVDWDAIDDRPVDLVVAVLSPSDGGGASINLLAKFARVLRGEETRGRLRTAAGVADLRRVFADQLD